MDKILLFLLSRVSRREFHVVNISSFHFSNNNRDVNTKIKVENVPAKIVGTAAAGILCFYVVFLSLSRRLLRLQHVLLEYSIYYMRVDISPRRMRPLMLLM